MSTYKTCKIIMLPTDENTNMYLNTLGHIHIYKDGFGNSPNFVGQYLYIISDEEIHRRLEAYICNL